MPGLRPFCMPKWGIEMTEGNLAEWKVSEGDAFTRGQLLCLIETAKITNEVEAEYDGVLARVLVPAGADAHAVGTLLAVTADPGTAAEEVDAFIAAFRPAGGGSGPRAVPAPAVPSEPEPAPDRLRTNRPISPEALKLAEASGIDVSGIVATGRQGRITLQDVQQALRPVAVPQLSGTLPVATETALFASPLARRLAAQHGIALAGITGTGARGRISKADVLRLVSASAPADAFDPALDRPATPVAVVPFAGIRKVVAQRLTRAKQEIPHFYLRGSARVDALLALRKTANLVLGVKASLNDYLVRACGIALARHPDVNVQVQELGIHRFAHADIAIAVATPHGLMTPIVRHADRRSIAQIAEATRALIDKANAGRLGHGDIEGGTFSISNLGMYGVEEFAAIINPPQGAILAVGATRRVPCERADGSIGFESRIGFTLSVDHRAIDGAAAAQFLSTLTALIEAPEDLFR